ncbi:MAG: DUF6686 family protein [bacterium]
MNMIISESQNGKVIKCKCCNKISIEFNNLNFSFTDAEFKIFSEYIKDIDGEYLEKANVNSIYNRKIVISVGHKNIRLLLKRHELLELRELLLPEFHNLPKYNKLFYRIYCN